jgi:RimK family alpha-L-glutamate ligase
MINFDDYINEAIENEVRVLCLTSRKKSGGYFRTARVIKDICEKKGVKHYIVFAEDAFISIDKNGNRRIYNIEDKKGFVIHSSNTVAIVRGSVTALKSSLDLLSQLERHNIFCINNRLCMEECSDKYRTALKIADAKISTPKTALVSGEKGIEQAFKRVGGKFPCVVKTLTGSKGVGVFIVDTIEGMKSSLQALWKVSNETEVLFQEYIKAKYDVRVHVLGGKVIAAMKRFKIKKDFRSNFSLGGKVGNIKLTEEQEEIAILAAKSVNASWAGVDLMIGEDGKTYVIEINSSPGTEGIEKATGMSVVSKVVNFALNTDNWDRTPTECGFIEKIHIEAIGEIDAKMDTGNGSYSVIHADKWDIKDGYVTWTHNGKDYEHKVDTVKTFKRGGVRNEEETRAVVLLNVTFNGDTYKDIRFSISNRSNMTTPILMNRAFLRKANLTVNSHKKYVLSINNKKDDSVNENIGIKGIFK